jgi:hypothetical protein
MPDTSSAAHRRHAHGPASAQSLLLSGVEPVDGTWFETGDESPMDEPLILLVPVRHERWDH